MSENTTSQIDEAIEKCRIFGSSKNETDETQKQMTFPLHATIQGKHIMIIGEFAESSSNELIENSYYIHDGKVWKYKKKLPSRAKEFPMISIDKELGIVTIPSICDGEITYESVENQRLNLICSRTPVDADFGKDENSAYIASSSAPYVPEILEEDDFLKKLIKTVFLIKNVATTKYRKKLSKAYAFSNLFQGLNSSTKVSTTVWQTWIEILGVDCVIILKDSGTDNEDPIRDYIVYKSRNDSLNVVKKDEIKEFLSENL